MSVIDQLVLSWSPSEVSRLLSSLMSESQKGYIDSPATKARRKSFYAQLEAYYTKLYSRFPKKAIRKRLGVEDFLAPKTEALGSKVKIEATFINILSEWVGGDTNMLEAILSSNIAEELAQGNFASLSGFMEEFGMKVGSPEKLLNAIRLQPGIADAARDYVTGLANDLEQRTLDTIAKAIADGMSEGLSPLEITKNLEAFLGDENLLESQIETIVRTETNRALSEGRDEAAKAIGASEKMWNTVGDDNVSEEICLANEEQGWIPFDEPFQSGDDHTPGHPNCRCNTIYKGVSVDSIQAELDRLRKAA